MSKTKTCPVITAFVVPNCDCPRMFQCLNSNVMLLWETLCAVFIEHSRRYELMGKQFDKRSFGMTSRKTHSYWLVRLCTHQFKYWLLLYKCN